MVLDWTHIDILLGSLQHKIGPIIEIYNLHMDLLMGVSNYHLLDRLSNLYILLWA